MEATKVTEAEETKATTSSTIDLKRKTTKMIAIIELISIDALSPLLPLSLSAVASWSGSMESQGDDSMAVNVIIIVTASIKLALVGVAN